MAGWLATELVISSLSMYVYMDGLSVNGRQSVDDGCPSLIHSFLSPFKDSPLCWFAIKNQLNRSLAEQLNTERAIFCYAIRYSHTLTRVFKVLCAITLLKHLWNRDRLVRDQPRQQKEKQRTIRLTLLVSWLSVLNESLLSPPPHHRHRLRSLWHQLSRYLLRLRRGKPTIPITSC